MCVCVCVLHALVSRFSCLSWHCVSVLWLGCCVWVLQMPAHCLICWMTVWWELWTERRKRDLRALWPVPHAMEMIANTYLRVCDAFQTKLLRSCQAVLPISGPATSISLLLSSDIIIRLP